MHVSVIIITAFVSFVRTASKLFYVAHKYDECLSISIPTAGDAITIMKCTHLSPSQ